MAEDERTQTHLPVPTADEGKESSSNGKQSEMTMTRGGWGGYAPVPGTEDLEMPTPVGTSVGRRSRETSSRLDGFSTPGANQSRTESSAVYQPLRFVARGGCGDVWESVQPSLARTIAIKRIREDIYHKISQDPPEFEKLINVFRQEALTTASLEHPNIVPVYDLGQDAEGQLVLSMKLVRGERWDHLIEADLSMPMADFIDKHLPILIDVTQAVAFAHSRGIIHRDLKPSQVMVGEFGEVLLMDWGLSLVVDNKRIETTSPHLFNLGIAPTKDSATNPAGSPAYMAPEQTENNAERIGMWTDIFLLGGTLYNLLTGTPPYIGNNTFHVFTQAEAGNVQHPMVRAPEREIPPELAGLAMDALKPGIHERVPSAKEFLTQLQSYLTGAGKRRESVELTTQVSQRIKVADGNYRELAECDSMLLRAQGLWPQNPYAHQLRQRVLLDFAQAAIDNEDLTLARVMAERLDEGEERADLINEISALEKLVVLSGQEAEEAESARRSAEVLQKMAEEDLNHLQVRYRRRSHAFQKTVSAMISGLESIEADRQRANMPDLLEDYVRQTFVLLETIPDTEYDGDLYRLLYPGYVLMAHLFMQNGEKVNAKACYQKAVSILKKTMLTREIEIDYNMALEHLSKRILELR